MGAGWKAMGPSQPTRLLLACAFLLGLLLAYTLVSDTLDARRASSSSQHASQSIPGPRVSTSRPAGKPVSSPSRTPGQVLQDVARKPKARTHALPSIDRSSNAREKMRTFPSQPEDDPPEQSRYDIPVPPGELPCNAEEHADLSGELVLSGFHNKQPSAAACCKSCKQHSEPSSGRPCNVWVWCPSESSCDNMPSHSCWLKWQPRPDAAFGMRSDRKKWVGGTLTPGVPEPRSRISAPPKRFHTAVTANANPYVQWQARIMYHWFKARKAQQSSDGEMGGFTRVLHDKPDAFTDEIPTCVVDRLSNEHGFVVMSRPQAIQQWLERCTVEEDYILMAEPDHLLLRPIPNLMHGDKPAAFPFFYINPYKFPNIVRKFIGSQATQAQIEAMDPIGNSPTFIRKSDLRAIAPTWANLTQRVKTDPEADKSWGWVQEMYAYSMASFVHNVSHDLHLRLMAQPPWDTSVRRTLILHYTYGCDYTFDGKFTPGQFGQWRFDKRSYGARPPPRNLSHPPDGVPETVTTLVNMINEATYSIPGWEEWASSFR